MRANDGHGSSDWVIEAGKRLEGLAALGLEVVWDAFQVTTLALLHDLREEAREAHASGKGNGRHSPEEAADELLSRVQQLGARANVDPGLVEQTLDDIQAALYRHIALPRRWTSWLAVQAAAQEAAEGIATVVAAIADEMVEIRDDYELTSSDEDKADTVGSMDRVIDYMRMTVATVRAVGAPAQG